MKFKVVAVIYNRNIYYTVAVNRGWRSLWIWVLPMTYHSSLDEAAKDLETCQGNEVFID